MVAAIWLLVVAQSAATPQSDNAFVEPAHPSPTQLKPSKTLPPVPYYYAGAIAPADLEGKTLRELNLIRNTIYARAGNVFRKHWLHDYFAAQRWYHPSGMDDDRLSAVDRKNAEIVTDYELAIPAEKLRARLTALEGVASADGGWVEPPDVLALGGVASHPPNDIERGLLRQELGIADPASQSPIENPAALDKLMHVRDLKDLSPRELRLVRNMIYARRGQIFTSKDLGSYFQRTEWYHPDQAFSASRLTALDQKNVRIVQSLEEQARGEGFGDRISGERFMMRG